MISNKITNRNIYNVYILYIIMTNIKMYSKRKSDLNYLNFIKDKNWENAEKNMRSFRESFNKNLKTIKNKK